MESKETKTTEVKAEVKEAVKEAAPAAVKEVKEEAKTEAKKAPAKKPGRKPAAKKTETAKAETKKTAAAAKKAPAKKTETPKKPGRKPGSKTKKAETEITTKIQFNGMEDIDVAAVQEKIQAKYVAEGHRVGAIKKFEIYINLGEKKAYYVINGKGGDSSYVDL